MPRKSPAKFGQPLMLNKKIIQKSTLTNLLERSVMRGLAM
jgi:hypothetical protein